MKLLRLADQARHIGVSRWTVARIRATDPTYPPERQISAGVVGVLAEELDAWLRSRPLVQPDGRRRKRSGR